MIIIDASEFTNKKDTFVYLNKIFDFSSYVDNLDSLSDSLIEIEENLAIKNYSKAFENLGFYGQKILRVFMDKALEYNIAIDFYFKDRI